MRLTTEQLDALAEAAQKATPGPWEIVPDSANGRDEAWCFWHSVGPIELMGKDPDDDSLFIAAADPQTVLSLVQEVRELRAGVKLKIVDAVPMPVDDDDFDLEQP